LAWHQNPEGLITNMVKPLVSSDPNPKDVRFSHFGVLDTGKSSSGAKITSIVINLSILLIMVVLGMVVKTSPEMQKKLVALTLQPKPPEPKPPPKVPPPPPPKPLPTPPKIELAPPKIKIVVPVLEKVPEIKPMPTPAIKPVTLATPAPKMVNPPPAPKVVNLSAPAKAASIANNDAHPSAVRLGNPEIKALNGPAVASPVNLGGGMHGMPPTNSGSGPPGKVNLGNGSPAGTDLKGRDVAAVPVKGLLGGVPGGKGTGVAGPVKVQIPQAQVATVAKPVPVAASAPPKPTLIYKPEPVYSSEAKAMHLEGTVTLHIKIHSDGSVEVINVVHGLGHGLDESATAATRATKFKPLVDANGHPTELETNVVVRFQLS
jgi:periplasmic protein TonB